MQNVPENLIQSELIILQVSFCSLLVFVDISDVIIMYELQCSNPLHVTFIYIQLMSITTLIQTHNLEEEGQCLACTSCLGHNIYVIKYGIYVIIAQ